jgi:hypothetical protein
LQYKVGFVMGIEYTFEVFDHKSIR